MANAAALKVSIHAPVKGRLYAAGKRRGLTEVSIHAPVKGRHGDAQGQGTGPEVSIHAPVKGRRRMLGACSMPWRFQSTPP